MSSVQVNYADLSRQYPEKWVALDGINVAGVGDTPKEALDEAWSKNVDTPVLTRVPKEYGVYVL